MEKYKQANRDLWNELTPIHARSAFYDVAGFKAGRSTLKPLEVEEVGNVAGKSLLHLQCHFGLDTLSWARRGAKVTGVDISDEAIALARAVSEEVGLDARFVRSDVYDLLDVLAGEFDVVYASYGVLCWLPDLRRWGEIVAHYVKPGGAFHMIEFHPFSLVFEGSATDLRVAHSYFHQPEPATVQWSGTYADWQARIIRPAYEWTHGLGDVLNALISAGLRIEYLHEFPYSCYDPLLCMEQGADGWWRLKGRPDAIPLMFSLRATK